MSAPGSRPLRLLLVEDNPGDVGLFTEALRETGATIELAVAADGREALAWLARRRHDRPDLVLLDFNLPKMGGLELLRALKAEPKWRALPVIALTSSRKEQDIVDFYASYGNCYLAKPGDYTGFVALVSALRDFWLTLAILPRRSDDDAQ